MTVVHGMVGRIWGGCCASSGLRMVRIVPGSAWSRMAMSTCQSAVMASMMGVRAYSSSFVA
eukprot:2628460-Rhodomonas_salina.1